MQGRNGFSLLEMLICVSIILILASFAVPRFTSAGKTAKVSKIQADIRTIGNAAALYELDQGKFPESVAVLAEKDSQGRQYLQFKPTTPDGGEYTITSDGVVSAVYDGVTYSSDQAPGKAGNT